MSYIQNPKQPDQSIKIGKYTIEEREAFLQDFMKRYLKDHPNAKTSKARKYAKVRWGNKIDKEAK